MKGRIFKMGQLKHVELLIESPVKEGSMDIKLGKIIVFNGHDGEKNSNAVKFSYRTESLDIVNSVVLHEPASNKTGFKAVNLSRRVILDSVSPFATDSCAGGQ